MHAAARAASNPAVRRALPVRPATHRGLAAKAIAPCGRKASKKAKQMSTCFLCACVPTSTARQPTGPHRRQASKRTATSLGKSLHASASALAKPPGRPPAAALRCPSAHTKLQVDPKGGASGRPRPRGTAVLRAARQKTKNGRRRRQRRKNCCRNNRPGAPPPACPFRGSSPGVHRPARPHAAGRSLPSLRPGQHATNHGHCQCHDPALPPALDDRPVGDDASLGDDDNAGADVDALGLARGLGHALLVDDLDVLACDVVMTS